MTMPGSSTQSMNDMNLTPLVDILLVLLIIFMVITPLAPRGLDALIPREDHHAREPQLLRTVVIQLSRDAATTNPVVKINGENASMSTLEAMLREIFVNRAERVAFVSADASLYFEQVAEVIDLAHSAGIDRIGLLPAMR